MFNHSTSSARNITKRLEAHNILPQIKDAIIAFKEENVKEVNRILTAFSEIGELPKSLSQAKLDYTLLRDENKTFDAFKSLYFISKFLTHDNTVSIIKDRLITRYPFDMKNVLFVKLNLVAITPDSFLDLLCFYYERDYDNEYGQYQKHRSAFSQRPIPDHYN